VGWHPASPAGRAATDRQVRFEPFRIGLFFKSTAATAAKPTFASSYALSRRVVIWRGWYRRSENEAADNHRPDREDDRPGA
jgi:hypothetical protein